MNENFKNLGMAAAVVVASLILGICFVIGISMLTKAIKAKEIVISDQSINKIIGAIQSAKQGEAAAQPKMPEPGKKRVEGVNAGKAAIKGKTNAPVLLVEFSDFQCPYSKMFYKQTFPQIDKDYIATGKVKFAYRDYPLAFHPQAKPAAIAAACAAKQNKYWQMFDKLMPATALDEASIQNYAKEIGLNPTSFSSCLKDEKIAQEVDKEMKEGEGFGVQGTPAFFINGRFVVGVYPFEAFKKIIEEELKSR